MKVTAQTIANYSIKARFKASEEAHLTQTVQEEISTASFRNIWDQLSLVNGDSLCQLDDYLAVDENAATSSIMTDEEIINAAQNATGNVSDNDQDDDDENEEKPKVRPVDAYSALRIYGLQMQNHAMENVTNQCEDVLLGVSQNNFAQKKITEYFE